MWWRSTDFGSALTPWAWNLSHVSDYSGKAVIAYDEEAKSYRWKDPFTWEDAICAVTRLYDSLDPDKIKATQVPITIGKNGKTTYCSDKGLDFNGTDEVKAFIATGFDKNEGTIWLTRVKDVPAGVPVLIKGKANETYNIPVTTGGTSHYENMFVGNTSGATITINKTSEDGQYTNYYMSGGQFKSVNGSANIGNNKSYLQLPTYMLAGARSEDASDMQNEYSFAELETESMPLILGSIGGDDGDTTGIRTTDCTDYTDESRAVWYDVQGRKYDGKPTKKGLYIHHGRKVVIK